MSEPKRFVVVDASGAESDIGRFIRDGHSRTLYECGGVAAARCLTKLLNESRPPVVEARSDDAALVLPGDAIAANAALAGIEMERRLAPNRYLEGVRAGIAAAAPATGALRFVCNNWDDGNEMSRKQHFAALAALVETENRCALSPEAVAGAAAAPGVESATWPWVLAFAREMEAKLAQNRHKGDREGWARESPELLLLRLKEEVFEMEVLLQTSLVDLRAGDEWERAVRGEAADVANFAMMIADVAGGVRALNERAAAAPETP